MTFILFLFMILYYVKVIEYEFIVSPTDFSAKQNKKGGGRYFDRKRSIVF